MKKEESLFVRQMKFLKKDSLFWVISFFIFIKSVIFMWIVGSNYAAGLVIGGGFFSVPPYMTYLAFAFLFTSITFLFKGRGHLWSLLVVDIFCTVLFIGHLWYYRGFSSFLNFFMFSMTSNLENLGATIISLFKPVDIIFILDILLFIVYILFNKKSYKGTKSNPVTFLVVFLACGAYLTFAHVKIDDFNRKPNGQSVFYQSWAPTETMSNLGPLGYLVFDGYNYYQNTKQYNLSTTDLQEISNYFKDNLENLPDNKYAGMLKGKNLLMIQVESLENFVIDQKVGGEEITPNINKLLKNSLYFDNFHEQVWNGTSADCDLMINTSVFPVRNGATFFRYPGNYYPQSLPNILSNMGYDTESIHPDKAQYWNYKAALTSIGYRKFMSQENMKVNEVINIGISDKDYFSQAVNFIDDLKQPFLAHTITLTNHAPFILPEKEKTLPLTDNLKGNVLGDYFETVHYTDTQIGSFLDGLDKKGLLDNTVVVIFGDHTGVHKYYQDKVNEVKDKESWMADDQWEIPFIIYSKGIKGEKISTNGGQVDTLPTLAYLMGAKKGSYSYAIGRNLLNTKIDASILANFGIVGNATEEEKNHLQTAMKLSDKIIQSNYFKNYNYK